jgi:hypothetical protein
MTREQQLQQQIYDLQDYSSILEGQVQTLQNTVQSQRIEINTLSERLRKSNYETTIVDRVLGYVHPNGRP